MEKQSSIVDRDVTYSCGACGYPLNLSSSNRNTSNIGSQYCKAIKKGMISFLAIDDSRFIKMEELKCWPYFETKNSWGFFRPRTKLLCGKCGMFIGHGYEDGAVFSGSDSSDSGSGTGVPGCRKYNVKIRALQPSDEAYGTLLTWLDGEFFSETWKVSGTVNCGSNLVLIPLNFCPCWWEACILKKHSFCDGQNQDDVQP